MKLPEAEREAHRAAFRAMDVPQKAEYIFAYYKLPIVLAIIAVVFIVSVAHRALTEKQAVLYVAYANVSMPEELDQALTSGFLKNQQINPRRSEVYCYRDLYLADQASTANHQYAYASRLKTLAATDAEQLDVVFMNREAYDLLSHSGYLLDLEKGLPEGSLSSDAKALLVQNEVVLEDNQIEVELGEADTYQAVTETHANALVASKLPLLASTDLTGEVYLGIIANTPRLETTLAYLNYLLEGN